MNPFDFTDLIKGYCVFVDDVRDLPEEWVDNLTCPAILIRTFDEAETFIKTHWEKILTISLDHDLGELDDRKTGYQLACMIENLVHATGHFPTVECHSANPVGKRKILETVKAIEKRLS